MRFPQVHTLYTYIRRAWPILPVGGLLLICLVAALAPLSCRTTTSSPTAIPSSPLRLEGVPMVRVRLTSQPVEAVDVGCTSGYRILVDGRDVGRSSVAMKAAPCRRSGGKWTLGLLTTAGNQLVLEPYPGGFVRVETTSRAHGEFPRGG